MPGRTHYFSIACVLALCAALLAVWSSGSHAHRHLGEHEAEGHHQHAMAVGHHHLAGSDGAAWSAAEPHADFSPTWHWDHAVDQEDIKVTGLPAGFGRLIPADGLRVALLLGVALLLPRRRLVLILPGPEPPPRRESTDSLRPPSRGPPSCSVA